jgi:hypothetical protein
MILIDYSGIAIAPVVMGAVAADDEHLMRHMILNSIRMYRQKFKQYGEVVIVADAGGNWRKEVYPQYKVKRAKGREESKIDWDIAFKNINAIYEEISENFPYKTIKQWGCEADDSIAEIVKWTQEFGNYEEVMIVSSDKDFKQLHKFSNVHQFSAITKKLIKVDNPRLTQLEHFLSGDAGDGVPNVLSPDHTFAEGIQQNTLTAKKKAMLMEDPKALGDEVYRNYLRNKKMIDLTETSECPENIKKEIIYNYSRQDKLKNTKKVFPYLIAKRCSRLLEEIKDFV